MTVEVTIERIDNLVSKNLVLQTIIIVNFVFYEGHLSIVVVLKIKENYITEIIRTESIYQVNEQIVAIIMRH